MVYGRLWDFIRDISVSLKRKCPVALFIDFKNQVITN